MVKFVGAELNELPEDVGAEFEQFKAQHKREASADGDLSLLFALSQHFIIDSFDERRGVPDTTPPTSANRIKSNVKRFAIFFSIFERIRIQQ